MDSMLKHDILFNRTFYYPYQKIIKSFSIGGCSQSDLLSLKSQEESNAKKTLLKLSCLFSLPSEVKNEKEWLSCFQVIYNIMVSSSTQTRTFFQRNPHSALRL